MLYMATYMDIFSKNLGVGVLLFHFRQLMSMKNLCLWYQNVAKTLVYNGKQHLIHPIAGYAWHNHYSVNFWKNRKSLKITNFLNS